MTHIANLFIYPIKSCGGIEVQSSEVGPRGLLHDRAFMIVDETGRMMTQREHPRMCFIRPTWNFASPYVRIQIPHIADAYISLEGKQDGDPLLVSIWDDAVEAMDQGDAIAKLLTLFLGQTCRLVRMPAETRRNTRKGEGEVGFADGYPALGISRSSLNNLVSRIGSPLPMDRFRPNIVFGNAAPFEEDTWSKISIGHPAVTLSGETLCARCAIPATDQETGERGKEPSATLAKYRLPKHGLGPAWKTPYSNKVYFGRNFNVEIGGKIEVRDHVSVLATD
jgi:uncharacterized protein YcbX